MRCAASWIIFLGLFLQACASPTKESRAAQTMTLFHFWSEDSSQELEQDYRFTAQIRGLLRSSRDGQSQLSFVRDFPSGMSVAEVIRSIQADLEEEFVYQPSGAQFGSSDTGLWSRSLAIGRGITVHEAEFLPRDPEAIPRIRVTGVEWAYGTAPVQAEVSAPILPLHTANITSWYPALEQEHDWQAGRGIDPWLIPDREYVPRQRKNAGLAAFIQLGFWVLGGKARS